MEVIEELWNQGYQISLDGENISYQKKEGFTPDPVKVQSLLQELTDQKNEAIDFLKRQSKARENSLVIFSKALNRDIVISWYGESPKVVFVDRTPYSVQEIQRLKENQVTARELRNLHRLKNTFEGQVQ